MMKIIYLQDNLCDSGLKLKIPYSYDFQQDSDPMHTAYITRLVATVGSKIIRALEIIRVKKLIPNAIL